MPSVFPGMDPYLESQKWRGFHVSLIVAMGDALVSQVVPRYVIDIEESVFPHGPSAPSGCAPSATALEPSVYTMPAHEPLHQRYLEVRERDSNRLVTAIELLSPANKTDGYRQYLAKRDEFLSAGTNTVEIDLLRGGQRLPTVEPLAPADYYAFICRHEDLPQLHVYEWSVRQPLPRIPVPLAGDDPDAWIDLQQLMADVYDRAGFVHSLDYAAELTPPLREADTDWACQLLAKSWVAGALGSWGTESLGH